MGLPGFGRVMRRRRRRRGVCEEEKIIHLWQSCVFYCLAVSDVGRKESPGHDCSWNACSAVLYNPDLLEEALGRRVLLWASHRLCAQKAVFGLSVNNPYSLLCWRLPARALLSPCHCKLREHLNGIKAPLDFSLTHMQNPCENGKACFSHCD